MEWRQLVNGTRSLYLRGQVIGQVSRSVSHGGAVHFWRAIARRDREWVAVGDFGDPGPAMDRVERWLIAEVDAGRWPCP